MNDGDSILVNRDDKGPSAPAKKRGRAFLVVLLTLFAVSMTSIVVVFDTSLEVEEAQAVQEVASRYRAVRRLVRMRAAVPSLDEAATHAPSSTALQNAETAWSATAGNARPSSRHAGGRPDLATPQGKKLYEDLLAAARREPDTKKRAGAVRSLAGMYGQQASDALTGIADDPTQPAEVRDVAAKAGRRNTEGSK